MKITILTSGNIRSNFAYRALVLARELRKIGHNVSVIAPSADKYNNFTAEKIDEMDGVKIHQPFQFKTKRLEINLVPYMLGATYQVLKERPDLVYIYKPTPVSVVGLFAKLFYKTKVVLDMDDLGSEVMKIEGHPLYQQKLVEWCEKLSAKYADRIVVTSTYLFDMYRKQFPNKPIYIMPNGVESNWFTPVIPMTNTKRIVFMGSINRKNILEPLFESLPDIIKKHPNVEIEIIGDGQCLSYFKEKAVTLDISRNITFTGWLKIEEAQLHLHVGDVGYGYMPNEVTIKAASNMKVPQYMARGAVPLVSDVGDLPATVDFGNAGYVAKADNPKELSSVLLSALEDIERGEKAKCAREFSQDNLDWGKLVINFDMWLQNKNMAEKDHKQRVYIIASQIPADVSGGPIRNLNLIKQLKKQENLNIEVFYISEDDTIEDRLDLERKLDIKTHVVPLPRSNWLTTLRVIVERVLPSTIQCEMSGIGDLFRKRCEVSLPDIVQVEQIDVYYCILPHIEWLKKQGVKIVLDAHNVEAEIVRASLSTFPLFKRLIGQYLLPNLKKVETMAAEKSDAVFTCSQVDASYFKKYNQEVFVIPNGVDCDQFQPVQKSRNPVLIFMGGVGYPANADGLEFYLRDIHPLVKTKIPEVNLLAIGATEAWLEKMKLKDSSIVPLGFVQDVKPYLDQALIGICPLRQGSGTRLKVLTYMAAGLPVVSTIKGVEGIGYTDAEEIMIADDPVSFASALVDLLNDEKRRSIFGTKAREHVLKNYDWNVIGNILRVAYKDLI